MKRVHTAILGGQLLSYSLILVFIFANHRFQFTSVFGIEIQTLPFRAAAIYAGLVAIVGTINVWLTYYYASRSDTMRDLLVVCAWTRRVKSKGKWISMEEFLTQQLGYAISHGLSDSKLAELRAEVDRDWRKVKVNTQQADSASAPQQSLNPNQAPA